MLLKRDRCVLATTDAVDRCTIVGNAAIAVSLITLALSFGATLASGASTFKAVPLDGGGWLSGFAQSDDGRIYAYGDVFGAWRTDDGGETWRYLNWAIPGGDIVGYGMAVQRDNSDVVYYSTNRSLWKSVNGGSTWQALLTDIGDSTPRFRGSSPILIRANNPRELWFAGPRKGRTGWLWRSKDGGASWSKAGGSAFDSNQPRTLHNTIDRPRHVWVGAADGLHVSTDGGRTFTRVEGLSDVGMIQRFASGPHAGMGVVTRGDIHGDGGGIARITAQDFEAPDTYVAKPSEMKGGFYVGYPTGLQVFADGSCSAWTTAADRHAVSIDGGKRFSLRPTTVNPVNVPIWTSATEMVAKNHPDYGSDQVIEHISTPTKRFITGGGAAMVSFDDGRSWQYLPNGSGIAAVKTYAPSVSRHDPNRIYIPASDIGSAIVTDGGASGVASFSTNPTVKGLHGCFRVMEGPNIRDLVFAGVDQQTNESLILRSADGGASWQRLDLSSSKLPAARDGIAKCVMSMTDADDFLVVLSAVERKGSVWRTTDGGKSFHPVRGLPKGLSTGHRYDPSPCFLERDATKPNVRYFTARHVNNSPSASIGLYRSLDSGGTWQFVTYPFGSDSWVWCMAADPVRGGNLWAAGDGSGVRVSRDGGETWHDTPQHFVTRHVASCDGRVAVFGRAAGDAEPRLYFSSNDGESFAAITDGDHNFHGVQGLAVDRKGQIWVSWNSCTVVTPDVRAPAERLSPSSGSASKATSRPPVETDSLLDSSTRKRAMSPVNTGRRP
jgi:photosystem II stability/assembly factor-like uncharacterized protein